MEYVKIYRIDNKGFYCKPYTSDDYHHLFEFIDTEVKDLSNINNEIPKSKLHKPKFNDLKWSGCFCFLEEFNLELLSRNGALSIRRGQKINLMLLPIDTVIWVRNCNHFGKFYPFYNEFTYPLQHEEKEYWFSDTSRFDCYKWVRMRVDLALERTRLWKEKNDYIPEELTEFYLMKSQKPLLKKPNIIDRFNCKLIEFKAKYYT